MTQLTNTKWLYDNLNNKNLVVLDCSWFLPSRKKNPQKEYKKSHIEG